MAFFNPIPFPQFPITSIQPFTYRDSNTFLELFEEFRDYLNNIVITGVNDSVKGLVDNYQAALDKFQEQYGQDYIAFQTLIDNFKTDTQLIVDTINNKSGMIDVQHVNLTNDYTLSLNQSWPKNLPIIYRFVQDSFGNHNVTYGTDVIGSTITGSAIINNAPNSVSLLYLIPVDGTGKFEAVNSDSLFHTNFVNPQSSTYTDIVTGIKNPLTESINTVSSNAQTANDNLETKLTTNINTVSTNLTQQYTDLSNNTYRKTESTTLFQPNVNLKNTVVVFGSSQTIPGKFPDYFGQRNGFIIKNYSVSGGGYTWPEGDARKYLTQLNVALADTTLDKTRVRYVFICDTGNDTRGLYSIQNDAMNLFPKVVSAFPTSRIIVIPALWSRDTGNMNADTIRQVLVNYQELKEAALGWPIEIIPNSWLWHWDSFEWIQDGGGVHYTDAGNKRVCYFVEKYLREEDMSMDTHPIRLGAAPGRAVTADNIFSRRIGQNVNIYGRFSVQTDIANDLEILTIAPGHCPVSNYRFVGVSSAKTPQTFYINPTLRAIRTLQPAVNGSVYDINITLPIFGGMS